MQDHYTPTGKHLTIADRRLIERWKQEGKSNREIAGLLGKAPQTINNEMKRGLVLQQVRKGKFEKLYRADRAQEVYEINRKNSRKAVSLTKKVKETIVHYIKLKWSPEMISKRKVNVPQSTIYYWMDKGYLGLTKADRLYPRKGKSPKKTASPNFMPVGKSIEERPEAITQRLEAGHYEIDTVVQTRAKAPCFLTLTDRKTRYEIIRYLPSKTAQTVNEALSSILQEYQITSITADNGAEFARLSEIFSEEKIYYAHPYCSWERGSNENHNRLIRRFLPKGKTRATRKLATQIEWWINNYPKRILNYKTPREIVFSG
ncbi:IS30 family transposase [Streptococcus chenjunshii]|uniref:IS30 family transposase n=1 Tax=Streptococcus chenjunshii TaxID=2173853 RepID=A0A346NB73_9STRE|nr:IS30 family transposase [Streptococcus chenjunshii]AXQ78268.1 IS30 family transposase [Streptococcus chenjunshii]AXQ79095.1 IS30 family transposase [Streptococcus chenjunshii]